MDKNKKFIHIIKYILNYVDNIRTIDQYIFMTVTEDFKIKVVPEEKFYYICRLSFFDKFKPNKLYRKLCDFDYLKYNELNSLILSKDKENIILGLKLLVKKLEDEN